MLKVNLTAVPAQQSLKAGKVELFNVAKEVGDYIYQNTHDPEEFKFAIRLFTTEGEIELTDVELEIVEKACGAFPLWLQTGIASVINEAQKANQAESGLSIDELEARRVKPEYVEEYPAVVELWREDVVEPSAEVEPMGVVEVETEPEIPTPPKHARKK